MGRRGVLLAAWALATAAATLVAWMAVRQVTQEVAAPTVLPLPSAVALADPSDQASAPAATRPRRRAPRRRTDTPVVVVTEPRRPARTEPAERQPPPTEPAQTQPEEPPPAESLTQAYRLTGGVVTVRYRSGATRLVSATPNSGFDLDVNEGGPGKVDVRFRSDEHESRLVTRWVNGQPDPKQEERPR